MIKLLAYFRRIFRYLRPYWFFACGSALVALLSAGVGLLAPWPMKILVDSVLGQEPLPRMLQFASPLLADKFLLLMLTVAAGLGITARRQPARRGHELSEHEARSGDDARLPQRPLPARAAAVDGVPRRRALGHADLRHQLDGQRADGPRDGAAAARAEHADAGRHVLDLVPPQRESRAAVADGRAVPLLLGRLLHHAHPPAAA